MLSVQKLFNVFLIVLQILHNRNSRGEDYWKIIDSALDEQKEVFSYRVEAKILNVSYLLPLAVTLILNKAEVEDWKGGKILPSIFRSYNFLYERNCSCCTGTNCVLFYALIFLKKQICTVLYSLQAQLLWRIIRVVLSGRHVDDSMLSFMFPK